MPEVLSSFRLHLDESVPEFLLPDTTGKFVSRSDASGPQGTLIIFACNHCPFVIHLADALGILAAETAAQGIGTVAINSNDTEKYPQDSANLMPVFAADHHWNFPYLIDETQEVAKLFGATCTPDFFLTNHMGHLFYTGQFDDSRPRRNQAAHGGDLREAIRRMLAKEAPLARPYPSSGCNIKWKPGNQPEWWNINT
ncbi:MAG: thioredoxin family protein [Gloeobacteraceae cyanobacterium ES-bin-144]|nr:thioredoxin family protein [Verrucomicrobiales bacterium]